MKTLCALILLGVLGASGAGAQVDTLHEDRLGVLYLSAWPDMYVNYLQPPPLLVPFDIYLVVEVDFEDIGDAAQNATNGIQAWEAQVTLPPHIFVLGATPSPATSINVGTNANNVYDYVVGTGTRVPAGGPQVLVTFQLLPTTYYSFWSASLGPVARPSVEGEAVWVESLAANGCSINGIAEPCIFRFAGLGGIRSYPRSGEARSFTEMKARF